MSTDLATRTDAKREARWTAHDGRRLQRWNELVERGETEEAAWLAVVTDEALGYNRWKGEESIPPHKLAGSLSKFLKRAAPGSMERARTRSVARISQQSADLPDTLRELRKQTENPKLQLEAVKLTMQALGVIGSGGATVNVSQQQATTLGDMLRGLVPAEDASGEDGGD